MNDNEIKEISKVDKYLLKKIENILATELNEEEYDKFYNYFNEIRKPNIIVDIKDDENIKELINQLQSNWNSLRGLIEQRIYLIEPKGTCINFYCEYDSEDDYVQGMKDQARLNTLKFILDKMNELEGKDKE